jgi:hypothetical protein
MRPLTSAFGTFQTWSDVRLESALRTKADVGRLSRYFIGAAGQFWNCKKPPEGGLCIRDSSI